MERHVSTQRSVWYSGFTTLVHSCYYFGAIRILNFFIQISEYWSLLAHFPLPFFLPLPAPLTPPKATPASEVARDFGTPTFSPHISTQVANLPPRNRPCL